MGIVEKIKAAGSQKERKELLAELGTYKYVSETTVRRAMRAAKGKFRKDSSGKKSVDKDRKP